MKTLVIVLSETRAHELSFPSFKQNLVDPLEADVCVCIGVKKNYNYNNPFYQLAKYHFIYDEENDPTFEKSVEYSYQHESRQNSLCRMNRPYMDFLQLKDRMDDQAHNFIISTYIHIFFLWFLQKNMTEYKLFDLYDRFIIVRSDYIYELPFPSMDVLDPSFIWIPNGEDYSGICDRSVVLSKTTIIPYMNILQNFYVRTNEFYLKISTQYHLNMEKILKFNLEQNGVLHLVKRFPYIMYCALPQNGSTRWIRGIFYMNLGYSVKYPHEYEQASYLKSIVHTYPSIEQFYKEKIAEINS